MDTAKRINKCTSLFQLAKVVKDDIYCYGDVNGDCESIDYANNVADAIRSLSYTNTHYTRTEDATGVVTFTPKRPTVTAATLSPGQLWTFPNKTDARLCCDYAGNYHLSYPDNAFRLLTSAARTLEEMVKYLNDNGATLG